MVNILSNCHTPFYEARVYYRVIKEDIEIERFELPVAEASGGREEVL